MPERFDKLIKAAIVDGSFFTKGVRMEQRIIRQGMLTGEKAVEKLKNCHVAVFGLGGVGSWCAEALARAGTGEVTLIDSDCFSESNINRQLGAVYSTINQEKTSVMASRLKDINPEIILHTITGTYSAENREEFFSDYDYVADAIDLVSCKTDLIASCIEREIPIISAMGTGNKKDASQLCITDISKTKSCPLARVMRRELRTRGIAHHTVVYSPEEPLEPDQFEVPPPGRRSIPGSFVWVPATAGLLMCQHIILNLISEDDEA